MDVVDDAHASRQKHCTKAPVLTEAKLLLRSLLRAQLPPMRAAIEDVEQQRGHNSRVQPMSAVFVPELVTVQLWKRALDLSSLVIVTPLLLPLVLFIALIIKAASSGPLLFRQERIGLLGRKFTLLKFRTMIPGSDTGVHEAHVAGIMDGNRPMTKLDARGDTRVIPFGRVLRAAGLDELPQLINVLRGEMSLVGPRPCLPHEYDRHLPWQKERFRTLPGLTGLWQVSGKNRTTFDEMIDLDMQYLRTQSPWLDLKIMLKTVPVLVAEVNGK
jgi:lipopolysaccharide/colanic/teichoic acid biosynthesis glycosyltransferase